MACKSYALAIFNHTCNIHNYCDLFTWAGKEKHLQEEWRSKFTSVLLTRSCEHFFEMIYLQCGFLFIYKSGWRLSSPSCLCFSDLKWSFEKKLQTNMKGIKSTFRKKIMNSLFQSTILSFETQCLQCGDVCLR